MDHEQVLRDLAQRLRDVAGQIHEPGTSPVGQFQNAVLFELPKAVRDGDLRMLELELVQLAGRIESYLGRAANLDIKVGRGTIRRILKDHLIEPAPGRTRRIPWSVFLKSHWRAIAASDFFAVEVWCWHGLITHYVLFVIELATRRVVICGITTNPNEVWMLQVARNLIDNGTGALVGKRHLIVDRDTKYSSAFRAFLARKGVEVIRLPPRSPNLNAYAERFVRSIKSECVSKLIPIGAPMLRRALREYTDHYHLERNH